jgi:hypothetical protein
MIIDVCTPLEVLKVIGADFSETPPYYYDAIRCAAEWIPMLTWAIIPLDEENPWGMFVTSREKRRWVGRVESTLRERNVDVFRV